jgi:hypothetical protein
MQNFMKIRPVEAELSHEDRQAHGRTDRHNAVNSRFSQFCEKRLKINISVTLGTFNTGKHAYNPMQERYWITVRMFQFIATLFKIYLERVLRNWKRRCQPMGIPTQNTHVYSLNFADDQVLIAQDSGGHRIYGTKTKGRI